MKLRELMNEIVKPNGPWTQTVAQKRLGIPQWKLSNFKNAADDSDYEKAWQDFLRLLEFCRVRNIDPAQSLKHPSPVEVLKDELPDDQTTSGDAAARKRIPKKAGVSTLPTRRTEDSQRKNR